jgi:hypothetical protein
LPVVPNKAVWTGIGESEVVQDGKPAVRYQFKRRPKTVAPAAAGDSIQIPIRTDNDGSWVGRVGTIVLEAVRCSEFVSLGGCSQA